MSDIKTLLRPVVEDAAQSIEYACGYEVSAVLAWFDGLPVEDVQAVLMGAVQDALNSALQIDLQHDYTS